MTLQSARNRLSIKRKGLMLDALGNLTTREFISDGRGLDTKHDSLIDYADVRGEDECWLWKGARNSDGYGSLGLGGFSISGHRLFYLAVHGSIPGGMHVLHRCDNPACVNPFHLFLGTHRENMRDAINKNRWPDRKGASNARAKLTNEQVLHMRSIATGRFGEKEVLAKRFGVSGQLVSRILAKKCWTHI